MQALRPKVGEATARRRLRSPLDWFRARAAFWRSSVGKDLPRVEQIWLPHYLVTFHVVSSKGPGEIAVSVDAYAGGFAVFHGTKQFDQLDVAEVYPPKLPVDEAIEQARKGMQKYVILARGQRHKPVVGEAVDVEHFQYPFWVYYYERARGYIDIRVLDGMTGEKVGHKLKLAVLDAFTGVSGTGH